MNRFSAATSFGFLVVLALPSYGQEQTFTGKTVGIMDGDTIEVMHNGTAERVRLNGIDCPEMKQAFGKKAKQKTSSLCYRKLVTVCTGGRDRYGRTIGDITLPNGKNLNRELVRTGFAWWYRKYAPDNKQFEELEQQARNKKRGLWKDKNPIPPWDFRKSPSSLHISPLQLCSISGA